jgi:hypothetical protein
MKKLYIHGDVAYIVLDQRPIHHFASQVDAPPDMQYVQTYMQWCAADHVLRTQTHFMFCETITDCDFEITE